MDPQPHGKPILCVDFDGCIHSYSSGWQGVDVIPDRPVPGVFEWLGTALFYFEIHVYSSRSSEPDGRAAMYRYVREYGGQLMADTLLFTDSKPRAFLTIDDRCICFQGKWSDPSLDPKNMLNFTPWYKK